MKFFFLFSALGLSGFSHAQSISDSIFYLRIGMENCQFRLVDYPFTYQTEVDSMYRNDPKVHSRVGTDRVSYKDKLFYTKDTTVVSQKFILNSNDPHKATLRFALMPDTVAEIDPFTLEEVEHLEYHQPLYQFETELRYKDFIRILKEGLELKNLKNSFRIAEAIVYYEISDRNGLVNLDYWNPLEKSISGLKCLSKGGLVLLFLKCAHGDPYILHVESGNGFIALIHIKK